jgi:formyltetrahydrofolate deformylase
MTAPNNVHAVDAPVGGRSPQVGREAVPANDIGRLLLRCADRPGLVAAVSTFLARAGANIVSLDQHSTERSGGTVMQRTIFHLPELTTSRDALECDFGEQVAAPINMDFGLAEASNPKRMEIMASKDDHCLLDLLWRNRRGELDVSVVMVISNHPDVADQARSFGMPFLHVPATKEIRAHAEQRQLDALRGNVDLVVLARYMQVVSPQFLAEVGCPLINIHHSFLPSCHGRSCGIAKTASSDTATRPSSSDGIIPSTKEYGHQYHHR